MKNLNKIKTYVGFAIRNRSIIYGVDSIKEAEPEIIFYSEELMKNSENKLLEFAKNKKCFICKLSKEEITEILSNLNIKAFAIKNKELAKAIKDNL